MTTLAVGHLYAQQIEPRIAGLEANAEYMSLLGQDAQLQFREDSIVNAVEVVRQQLRNDPERRQSYSQGILKLEGQIFDIRNAKGRLVGRINTIEQEWVLANLGKPTSQKPATDVTLPKVPDSLIVRNMVYNKYFRDNLSAEDYAILCRAQSLEWEAVEYVNRYFANYDTVADLAAKYAQTDVETEALEIHDTYAAMQRTNQALADSLSATWSYIFDNKSYSYNYLLDLLDKEDVLSREEEAISQAAIEHARLSGQTASDAVADYFLRKKVLVDYEATVAGLFGLQESRDSLRGVKAQLEGIDFRLPKIEVAERTFLDYDSIAFSVVSQYTYKNPIPECRIYARGTIYRILLGTFNGKRAAATFKGVYPLSYLIDESGKWSYYAGGFATFEEAVASQAMLKKRGFLRPEVASWSDGEYRNLTSNPSTVQFVYRVEIAGTEALSDLVKSAIIETADGSELSRVGQQLFVVGIFSDKAIADRVAAAIALADGALEIKVAKITQ